MYRALRMFNLEQIKGVVHPIPSFNTHENYAAVLLPLIPKENEWEILFVHRSNNTPTHKGQVAFPGGRVSTQDHSYTETVLRETREETNIPADAIKIIGALPPRYTYQARLSVLPIVGVIEKEVHPQPDSYEIIEVFQETVTNLLSNYVKREVLLPNGTIRVMHYYKGKHLIWGFTARVLHDFFSRIGLQQEDNRTLP